MSGGDVVGARCRPGDEASVLRIARWLPTVRTVGPSPAAGVWVQGCGLRCPGCMSPDTWDRVGGVVVDVEELAGALARTGRSHLTLSGGEPFEQAAALLALVRLLRVDRDWVVTCYSGFRLEDLRCGIRPGSVELLGVIDVLIDGPYRRDLHAPLLWRGSSNQRIHDLTGRVALPADRPAGLELHVQPDGRFELVGVPTHPDHFSRFVNAIGSVATFDSKGAS